MKRRPPRSTRTDTPALHDALPIYIPIATITLRLTQPWTLPQAMLLLRDDPARLHFGQWLFSRGDAPGHTSDDASASRSEEHTSELQSLMRISYAVFCLKKKTNTHNTVSLLLICVRYHINYY